MVFHWKILWNIEREVCLPMYWYCMYYILNVIFLTKKTILWFMCSLLTVTEIFACFKLGSNLWSESKFVNPLTAYDMDKIIHSDL